MITLQIKRFFHLTFYQFSVNIINRRFVMKKFVVSLSALLLTVPVAMAQSSGSSGSVSSSTAVGTALTTLSNWAGPAIDTLAILVLVIGIVGAAFELFKRSIGWAIGLFIGASILFAVLWAIASPIQSTLSGMAGLMNTSSSSSSNNNG